MSGGRGEPIRKNLDFSGKEREKQIPLLKECKYGVIHEYPAYLLIDNRVVIMQPILNLISDPDIIFCKDKKLYDVIRNSWKFVAKKFLEGKSLYNKENPIQFIPANWSYNPESRKRVEEKFQEALKRNRN